MDCPSCGNKKARKIDLCTWYSYLCPERGCQHYDHKTECEVAQEAFSIGLGEDADLVADDSGSVWSFNLDRQ